MSIGENALSHQRRAEIEKQVAEYLAKGGTITELPVDASADNPTHIDQKERGYNLAARAKKGD